MVVDDLYAIGMAIPPLETDPPLLVDSNAVPTVPIPLQRLKAVAGRNPQILDGTGVIEHSELAPGHYLQVSREAS